MPEGANNDDRIHTAATASRETSRRDNSWKAAGSEGRCQRQHQSRSTAGWRAGGASTRAAAKESSNKSSQSLCSVQARLPKTVLNVGGSRSADPSSEKLTLTPPEQQQRKGEEEDVGAREARGEEASDGNREFSTMKEASILVEVLSHRQQILYPQMHPRRGRGTGSSGGRGRELEEETRRSGDSGENRGEGAQGRSEVAERLRESPRTRSRRPSSGEGRSGRRGGQRVVSAPQKIHHREQETERRSEGSSLKHATAPPAMAAAQGEGARRRIRHGSPR